MLTLSCRRCAEGAEDEVEFAESERLTLSLMDDNRTLEVTCREHGHVSTMMLAEPMEGARCECCGVSASGEKVN